MIKGSVSIWLFIAAVSLFLLQALPIPGIFLMILGAGFINALLIYAFLLALFVESITGRLPRILAIVPIVAFAAYYGAYFLQQGLLAGEVPKLNSINVGKVMDFDPATQSLVFDDTNANQVEYFVARYRIPVAYGGDFSARMAPVLECSSITSFHNGAFAWVRSVAKDYPYKMLTEKTAPCMLTRGETPPKQPVHVRQVDHASPMLQRLGITEPSTDIEVDGRIVGSIRRIVVRRISPLLWFVGCVLVDNPSSWTCTTSFFDERKEVIVSNPAIDSIEQQLHERVSTLLGIQQYNSDDILHFAGYPENAAIIALAKSPEHPVESHPAPMKNAIGPLDSHPTPPKDAIGPGTPGVEITGAKLLRCHDHDCVEQPLAPR